MHTQKHQLLKKLSQKLGKQIPLVEGAAVISINDDKVYLEFPEPSPVYIVHMEICSISSLGSNLQHLEAILQLNSRLDVLCCGWLGFHKSTNTLRYFNTLPAQLASENLLLDTISAMVPVKQKVIRILNL
ncbi:hypothetical protein TDB9533_00060 [Thalassocella blandensis]|nr:hypothetical protein TDB9533_00060 [Thalassocella blandensis]